MTNDIMPAEKPKELPTAPVEVLTTDFYFLILLADHTGYTRVFTDTSLEFYMEDSELLQIIQQATTYQFRCHVANCMSEPGVYMLDREAQKIHKMQKSETLEENPLIKMTTAAKSLGLENPSEAQVQQIGNALKVFGDQLQGLDPSYGLRGF